MGMMGQKMSTPEILTTLKKLDPRFVELHSDCDSTRAGHRCTLRTRARHQGCLFQGGSPHAQSCPYGNTLSKCDSKLKPCGGQVRFASGTDEEKKAAMDKHLAEDLPAVSSLFK
jgi:hypothetical protein